jgi:hypothetical protein
VRLLAVVAGHRLGNRFLWPFSAGAEGLFSSSVLTQQPSVKPMHCTDGTSFETVTLDLAHSCCTWFSSADTIAQIHAPMVRRFNRCWKTWPLRNWHRLLMIVWWMHLCLQIYCWLNRCLKDVLTWFHLALKLARIGVSGNHRMNRWWGRRFNRSSWFYIYLCNASLLFYCGLASRRWIGHISTANWTHSILCMELKNPINKISQTYKFIDYVVTQSPKSQTMT